jgi:hypothetical protein
MSACVACTAAWTHFVKAAFRKHSGDMKKAPSASLARSIFVTWLNGVPYDTHDSPFLNGMKLTAAEYQTHSLAIANSHYDKDAASEAKLRVLVDFCDAYSQWQPDEKGGAGSASSFSGRSDSKDNVDSDDDERGLVNSGPADMEVGADDSAPAGASASSSFGSSSAAPFAASSSSTSALPVEIKKPARRSAKARASSSARKKKAASSDSESSDSSSSDGSDDEDEDEKAADADDAEYLPDRIIAKKTVAWQDFYLIHWLGYTAAERTWEPVAYFDQYCTKQTHDYEQARRPVRILGRKARPGGAGESKSAAQELFFEVQWQGRSSETSMEREGSMLEDFPDLVKDWQRREEERNSRKHPRDGESKAVKGQEADGGGAERPAKRRCKGAGASSTSGS